MNVLCAQVAGVSVPMGQQELAREAVRSGTVTTRPEGTPPTKFDEGKTYLVSRLWLLDVEGGPQAVEDVAVVFTPGWLFVQEANRDGYVLPRERVLRVEGIKSPR